MLWLALNLVSVACGADGAPVTLPGITDDVFTVLGVQNSVNSGASYGGTAPTLVRAQISRWQALMG
jgi:argininosuccinate lyase